MPVKMRGAYVAFTNVPPPPPEIKPLRGLKDETEYLKSVIQGDGNCRPIDEYPKALNSH